MGRPVTLFTGQWADLPIADLAPLVKQMGYDGVELACWGDHFDVRMDRVHGGTEAAAFVKKVDFTPNAAAFDAAFAKKRAAV